MADLDVGKVTVEITGETGGLSGAVREAQKSLGKLSGSAAESGKALTTMDVAVGAAAGTLGAQFALKVAAATKAVLTFASTVTKSSAAAVNALHDLAQETGVTLQQFQQLEPVMQRQGVSSEQMSTAFRMLARNIQQAADPSSRAAKAFDELGIALSGTEEPSQVLALIADRVKKLPDGFEKAAIMSRLFGISGAKLIPILNEGADGLKRSADEARKMGNELNTHANDALLRAHESFKNLETAQANLRKHFGVLFAPLITGYNNAMATMINFSTTIVDKVTIATRTLAIRFQAFFGFLTAAAKYAAQGMIGSIGEAFTRWDEWATEQIAAIRAVGVTAKDTGKTIGEIDQKALAAAEANKRSWQEMSWGLVQLDMGWKIVQESINAYGKSQEALGRFITTQLIEAWNRAGTIHKQWSDQALTMTQQQIDAELALQAAYDARASAARAAQVAAGTITPLQMSAAEGAQAIAAIERQIAAVMALNDAQQQAYLQEMARLASMNASGDKRLALMLARTNQEQQVLNQLAVLRVQLSAASITASSNETLALQQEQQKRLAAWTATAGAELRIAQALDADVSQLRALRARELDLQLQQELSVVGLTEEQKTAIYRRHEAERMNIARQFPTFYQKQLMDLVNSNTFALSQITTSFTNATAQWIVTGQNFKAFWTNLQVTIVQAFLNTLVQIAAKYLLHTSLMEGITTAFETAKTAIVGTQEAARTGIVLAASKAQAISAASSLLMMAASGQGAILVMVAAMEAAVAMMVAIASALAAGVVTAPASVPVSAAAGTLGASIPVLAAAGLAGIATAVTVATGEIGAAVALAKGGIVTGPTLGLLGEAGSPEAAIPLNDRGARFMQQTMGLASPTAGTAPVYQEITVELDGRVIARSVSDQLPTILRLRGVQA